MTYCCSQCSFTAQFESALMMHKELHHDATNSTPARFPVTESPELLTIKSKPKMPRVSSPVSPYTMRKNNFRLPTRTSSATKLFCKLKAKICKSKTLFSHPEEPNDNILNIHNMSVLSDCTSKALKVDSLVSNPLGTSYEDNQRESYGCHLCSFIADRITVLDRHLLNDHKIGLENLLKLVMAKTKDGLAEDNIPTVLGIRQPYYKPLDEIIEDGEFIIETVVPKVKILKHTATNTDLKLINMNHDKANDDWKIISDEIENMMKVTKDVPSDEVMNKMKVLNDYMRKFVSSSNTLKKVLDSKVNVRSPEPTLHLGLGDRDTARDWEKAHSEKMDRRSKYPDNSRSEKIKMSSESFYF